jgi:hypothetical protein
MLLNAKGGALAGVLVGAAIVSVLITGIMSTIELGASSESRLNASAERRQLELELNEVLKTPNCGLGTQLPLRVNDRNWPSTTIFPLQSLSSQYLTLTSAGRFGTSTVASVALAAYLNKATGVRSYVALGTTSRKASLRVDLTRGMTRSQLNIPVIVQTNPAGDNITSCLLEEQQDLMAGICASLGGTWNPGVSGCSLPPPPPSTVPTDPSSFASCGVSSSCGVSAKYIF